MVTARQLGAVVLCGGHSRRMGWEKAALPFGPETMLERVLRLVAGATTSIVISAAAEQRIPGPFPVARDPADDEGPLPGLLRAAALVDAEAIFVVACDTPLLEPALIPFLCTAAEGWEGAVPLIDGQRIPTCAVYRKGPLLGATDTFGNPRRRSLHDYVYGLRVRDVDEPALRRVDPELRSFLPCNTPDEYRRALRLAGLPVNDPLPPAV